MSGHVPAPGAPRPPRGSGQDPPARQTKETPRKAPPPPSRPLKGDLGTSPPVEYASAIELQELELRHVKSALSSVEAALADERANYQGAMADLSALVEVAREALGEHGIEHLARFLRDNYPEETT